MSQFEKFTAELLADKMLNIFFDSDTATAVTDVDQIKWRYDPVLGCCEQCQHEHVNAVELFVLNLKLVFGTDSDVAKRLDKYLNSDNFYLNVKDYLDKESDGYLLNNMIFESCQQSFADMLHAANWKFWKD